MRTGMHCGGGGSGEVGGGGGSEGREGSGEEGGNRQAMCNTQLNTTEWPVSRPTCES